MKILHLSDGVNIPTGYANQSRLLLQTLHDAGHKITHLAHSYAGIGIKNAELVDGTKLPYKIVGTDGSPYCRNLVPELVSKEKIELFGVLLDTFMLKQAGYDSIPLACKTFFWFPSDGGFFPDGCETILRKFNFPVAMSKFGRDQVKKLFSIDARYIPHGVKSQKFRPFTDAERFSARVEFGSSRLYRYNRGQYVQVPIDLSGKTVFGCVARNQGRKALPDLLKAFSHWSKNRTDVVLVMHSDPQDHAQICDSQSAADRYGGGHNVFWTGMSMFRPYSEQDLVKLYNVMDCFALLTTGEGFGIPYIEAMSCGVPVIATDGTTTKEIVTDNGAGLAVRLMGEKERPYPDSDFGTGRVVGGWGVERYFADHRHAGECFDKMMDSVFRKECGVNARRAVLESYDWDSIVGPAFVKFVEEVERS